MTTSRDPDRLIQAFLMEGAEELPDAVYDAVRADIDRKRQRAVLGPWRMPALNKLLPIGLGAAAAVALAVVVGTQLLPRAPGGVGSEKSAAPSASQMPSATPAASAAIPSPSRAAGLPQGTLVLQDGNIEGVEQRGVPVTVTIAAPGWFGDPNGGILVKNENADPPNGAGIIVFNDGQGWFVPGDPCSWSTTIPAKRATTAGALAAALAAQASRQASTVADITVGGRSGKSVTLHVPGDANFNRCDGGRFCTLADPEAFPADACARYSQGPGQIDHMWVVDVGGRLVVLDWATYAGTPSQDAAELEAIARSAVFE